MDTIYCKYAELFDVFEDKEEEISEIYDCASTNDQDGTVLDVNNYRVVVPKIERSYRLGTWWKYNGSACLIKSSLDYELQDNVVIEYEADEKDINNYILCSTAGLQTEIEHRALNMGLTGDEIDEMDCYIEFDSFDSPTDQVIEVSPELKNQFSGLFSRLGSCYSYTLNTMCGQDGKYYFRFDGSSDMDLQSVEFLLDLNNSKYELLVDGCKYILEDSYEGLLNKLEKVLKNEIVFVTVPQFLYEVKFSRERKNDNTKGRPLYISGTGGNIQSPDTFGEDILEGFIFEHNKYNKTEPLVPIREKAVEESALRDEINILQEHYDNVPYGHTNMKTTAAENGKGYISIREIGPSRFLVDYIYNDIHDQFEFDYNSEKGMDENTRKSTAAKIQGYYESYLENQ